MSAPAPPTVATDAWIGDRGARSVGFAAPATDVTGRACSVPNEFATARKQAWPPASAHPAAATSTSVRSLSVPTRVLYHPSDEVTERPAGVPRQLGHEGSSRHARLRVHFQADQFMRSAFCVVEEEIGPPYAQ